MKILVGIMHCIENELKECLSAIDQQTYPAHDRFILSNLSNKEAHDRLYSTFMEQGQKVDLFIKIDADMVLSRKTFFEEVINRFNQDKKLQHLQIALDDWYTNTRIMGLHVYRSNYKWIRNNNELHFVDTLASDTEVKMVRDYSVLAPAAMHCPNPSPFQAFHFGIHKAVKVLQRGRADKNLNFSFIHWGHFVNLEANYKRTQDYRLGLAMAGFLHAIRYLYEHYHVDFSCDETKNAFNYYSGLSQENLNRKLLRLGSYAWSILPQDLRYELMYYHNTDEKRRLDFLRVINRWRLHRFSKYNSYIQSLNKAN